EDLAPTSDVVVSIVGPNGALLTNYFTGGVVTDVGNGIALDAPGNVYVTGYTNGGFPVLNAFQPVSGGATDGFVLKLTPFPALATVYSTYLGGTKGDFGYGVAADAE